MREIIEEFGLTTIPSLHVGDKVEDSIAAVEQDGWVALLETGPPSSKKKHPFYTAKQPNGHARMLTCSVGSKSSEITRVIPERVMYAYLNVSSLNILKITNDVIPAVMAKGGSLVICVSNPLLDHYPSSVLAVSGFFQTATICKPLRSDVLEPEIFVVLQGFASSKHSPCACESSWIETIQLTESIRAANTNKALDLIAYFNGIGLDTEEDCSNHELKTLGAQQQ